MSRLKQKGFAALELLLVVAVIATICLLGYKVYSRSGSKASETNSSGTSSAQNESSNLGTVPEVKDKSDLDKAAAALDQNDTTGANSSDDNVLKAQATDN
jgi:prepilin-type N-terminal cleavage/methylation domain-containing protein